MLTEAPARTRKAVLADLVEEIRVEGRDAIYPFFRVPLGTQVRAQGASVEVGGVEPPSPGPSVRILRAQPVSGLGRVLVTGDPALVPVRMVVSRRGSGRALSVSRS